MRLTFKVCAMVERSVVVGDRVVPVVLVKLIPVDQPAGDVLIAVENPTIKYKPEEWLRDRDGAQVKRIVMANTVIESASGEAGGKSVEFVQDAEYTIDFAAAKK